MTKLPIHPFLLAFLFVVTMTTLGCNNAETTIVEVTGTVSLPNGPLHEGLITFVPIRETTGPKVSTAIENGSYTIGADKLLAIGSYQVQVYGLPPGVKAIATGGPISHERSEYQEISSRFNSQSELTATLSEGSNVANFNVDYK